MVVEEPETQEAVVEKTSSCVSLNDFLLLNLENKFDRKTDWQGDICVNLFYDKNVLMVGVYVSEASGKIKVVSRKHRVPIVVKLESVKQVNDLLGMIL